MALSDPSEFSTPPPSSRSSKTANRAKQETRKVAQTKTAAREEAANGVFQLAGFGCIIAKQYSDAGAISLHGANISHELAKLSESNEGVGRILDYLLEAGPYAGVITATMPLVLQLLANHNVVKASMVAGAGVQSPEALAAQVEADMARQAQAAFEAQREAQEAVRVAQEMMAADAASETPSPNGSEPERQPTGWPQ